MAPDSYPRFNKPAGGPETHNTRTEPDRGRRRDNTASTPLILMKTGAKPG